MTKLITPMPLSPHAKTVGVTAIDADEIVVDNIDYFATPADGEEGYALLCAVRDFKSNNPADYQGVTYTGRDVANNKITGVTHCEGTPREWPAGTSIACYSSAEQFKRINEAIKSLQAGGSGGGAGGFRNKLINGDFGVWQRGTSFTTGNEFTADRWYFASDTDDTITVSRQSFSVGQLLGAVTPKYYLRVSVTAGSTGALNRLQQLVENVRTLAGQDATLSFYARASKSITVSAQIKQDFGTGGSPSAAVYTAAEGLFITTDWAHYEATFAVPSVSGKTLGTDGNDGMGVVLNLPYNDTYTFDICLAQFEAGDSATSFEERPADIELLLCGIVDDDNELTGADSIPQAVIDGGGGGDSGLQNHLDDTTPHEGYVVPRDMPITEQTGETYTLQASDNLSMIKMNRETAQTLIFPLDATASIPVGGRGIFVQAGAGKVTVQGEVNGEDEVTLLLLKDEDMNDEDTTTGQNAMAGWVKDAANTFRIRGDLEAGS